MAVHDFPSSGADSIDDITGLQAALDGKLDLYTSPMYLANSALTGGRIIANDVDATRVVSVDLTYSGAQAFATLTAEDAGGIYSEVSAGTDGVTNYHEDGGGKFAGIYLSSAYPEGRVTVETDGKIHLVTGVDDRITVNNDGTVALHATTAASLAAALGAGAPTGTCAMWGTGSAPTGWLLADGSAVSRTTYSALFALIGTTFGAGDGSTTFALPDFRGRAPIGAGTGSGLTARTLAGTVGTETHTLTAAESGLPSHTHNIGGADTPNYGGGTNPLKGTGSGASTNTGSTGGTSASSAHNNMQPSLVINFIIKT